VLDRKWDDARVRRVGLRTVASLAVLVAVMASAGCTPSSGRFIDEVFPNVTETLNLAYGSAPDENGSTETLRLDLFQPQGDTRALRPAVIFLHGGSFCCGSRALEHTNARAFARRGYVAVAVSYRLRSGNIGQAMLDAKHDAQAAVRWLRAHATEYRIDPDQIAAVGTSAGAITALNVGNNPEDPGNSGNPGYPSDIGAAVSVSGFGNYHSPGDAPAILFHGLRDDTISHDLAIATCENARAHGNVCELHSYDAGHNLGAHRAEIYRLTANFLYRHLHLTQ
jgi:predicted esterase